MHYVTDMPVFLTKAIGNVDEETVVSCLRTYGEGEWLAYVASGRDGAHVSRTSHKLYKPGSMPRPVRAPCGPVA